MEFSKVLRYIFCLLSKWWHTEDPIQMTEFPYVQIVNVKLATKSMTAIRGGETVSSNFKGGDLAVTMFINWLHTADNMFNMWSNFKGGDLAVTMLKTDYTWICQNVVGFRISPILKIVRLQIVWSGRPEQNNDHILPNIQLRIPNCYL